MSLLHHMIFIHDLLGIYWTFSSSVTWKAYIPIIFPVFLQMLHRWHTSQLFCLCLSVALKACIPIILLVTMNKYNMK